MCNRISITLSFLLLLVTSLHSQYVQVATNPASLLFASYKIELEFPLAPRWSVQPEIGLITKGQRFWSKDYESEGRRLGVMIKRYMSSDYYNEGYYGFAYFRNSDFTFTDYIPEEQTRDQRDFKRDRNTFGFGMGYNRVGADGFFYGFSLGLGRHSGNEKQYTTPALPNESVSRADDEEIFDTPLDVYGRIAAGVRFFRGNGAELKAQADEQRLQDEEARLEKLRSDVSSEDLDELELRRQQHRLRNGNG